MQLGDFGVSDWERVGRIGAESLASVRKELHRAVQFPAAIGRSLARSEAEHIHTTLRFWASAGTLVSRESAATGIRLGLAPADRRLLFFGPGRGVVDAAGLVGRTSDQIWAWIASVLEETGTRPDVLDREHPEYELDAHRLDDGEPFRLEHAPACAELARQFANAHRLLCALVPPKGQASPARTWPGPFATVRTTECDPQKRLGRGASVTYGFCAGDGDYEEPYWYVLTRPMPQADEVSELPGPGSWHRGEWVGTVLPVSRLAEVDDQPAAIVEFLRKSRSATAPTLERQARKGAE